MGNASKYKLANKFHMMIFSNNTYSTNKNVVLDIFECDNYVDNIQKFVVIFKMVKKDIYKFRCKKT
jgi:hypothetical protein